ncbi:hypothetical protein FPSE_11655 [Fusarium pseudograminearum CS3096]|uniref:Uncharacterized protein n=1 Tax=Fusarium pseudograminearum (strain CS3096) TaxID=1028729 RepID=K3V8G4_FUSPC|nr:hypothetical protein FPSE_11655 [Fusarium pseudograminearum CS3096]EKJ68188.1 hypothetical protein FPSE_11655 [Fusarium pseudograminearum CS3096]KAF0638192.1 hypothetical protein FPSE5266_11655 [Fusarium pseudograminearum]
MTPPSLAPGALPFGTARQSQPRPTRPINANENSKENLPSLEETVTQLGLGKDCAKAARRRFAIIRSESIKYYLKKHQLSEKNLEDWSNQECRSILREIALYFLHDKSGATFWTTPYRLPTLRYVFSKHKPNENEKILELLIKYLYLFINSNRRKAQKPRMRRKFLQGKGGCADSAIDIDYLSDDAVLPTFQESSTDRVPKREPVSDSSGIDQDIMPLQQTLVHRPSKKRSAEAELPQAQNRAKSIRLHARDSGVGLPSDGTEEEEEEDEDLHLDARDSNVGSLSDWTEENDDLLDARDSGVGLTGTEVEGPLFFKDDTPIYDSNREWLFTMPKMEPIHESSGVQVDVPVALNAESTKPETPEEDIPADVRTIIQNSSSKDSATVKPVCNYAPRVKPLRDKVANYSSGRHSRSVPQKGTDKTSTPTLAPTLGPQTDAKPQKEPETVAVPRLISRLDTPNYVPEQTCLPPLSEDIPPPSETIPVDLTLDGLPDDSPTFFHTKDSSATKNTNPYIPNDIDGKYATARTIQDEAKESPFIKTCKDTSNENPYHSLFKMATPKKKHVHFDPELVSNDKKPYFDSEHAKKILNSHLRNHAKATSTPIRFSFSMRHSASHADMFKFSPMTFFTMSLRELVAALPMEDKDQISGLCIRQYGLVVCLRQVYLYNEEVFGNIRDEFISYVETDIRNAKCTGATLDYEISIEPIMEDY